MKITKSQLKQIIKEELGTLQETEYYDYVDAIDDIIERLDALTRPMRSARALLGEISRSPDDEGGEIGRSKQAFVNTAPQLVELLRYGLGEGKSGPLADEIEKLVSELQGEIDAYAGILASERE